MIIIEDINFTVSSEELMNELNEISKHFPKHIKKQVKVIGNKLNKVIKDEAKILVKKGKSISKKSYHNGFKVSKVWENDGIFKVSNYNSRPHAHLIEYGHKIIHKGNLKGFVEGKYPLKIGILKYIASQLEEDLEIAITNVLNEGVFK